MESIKYLESQNSIWDMFDGMVISCRVQKVKPEQEIYEYLLTEFNLVTHETVFIDDMDVNLKTASHLGIKTILFFNPAQCRQELVMNSWTSMCLLNFAHNYPLQTT
jgi:FMN phosphatase YigB (HAD superfamily)